MTSGSNGNRAQSHPIGDNRPRGVRVVAVARHAMRPMRYRPARDAAAPTTGKPIGRVARGSARLANAPIVVGLCGGDTKRAGDEDRLCEIGSVLVPNKIAVNYARVYFVIVREA
jgi:hypothetical protein